jgi:hypothetical protein
MDKVMALAAGVVLGAGGVLGVTVAAAPGDVLIAKRVSSMASASVVAHATAIASELFPGGASSFCLYANEQGGFTVQCEGMDAVAPSKLPADASYTVVGKVEADGKAKLHAK